jgi:large subunit ribosomal protein L15
MKLSKLPKTTSRSKKRVGRGYGSGKGGHTAGRGTKGQKARGKTPFGLAPILSRLPLKRGRGKSLKKRKPLVVNVKFLNSLPPNTKVTLETLFKHKIINKVKGGKFKVKILGNGELKVPLEVALPCSSGAVKRIETAGGKVVMPETKKPSAPKIKSLPKTKKTVKSKDKKINGGKK